MAVDLFFETLTTVGPPQPTLKGTPGNGTSEMIGASYGKERS